MHDELSIYLNYHLRAERNLAVNTIQAYRSDLNQFFRFVEGKRISNIQDIDYELAVSYKKQLIKSGLSGTSINRKIAPIKSFFDFLYDNKYLKKQSTAVFIESVRAGFRLPHYLTESESKQLIESVNQGNNRYYGGPFWRELWDTMWIRDRAFVELLYATGARISEAITLKKSNVNFNEKTIKVMGKGSRERIIPIGKIALQWIRKYLQIVRPVMTKKDKSQAMDILFLNRNGRPMTRQAGYDIVELAGDVSGLNKNIYPHILRHSVATHLLDRRMPVEVLQEFLGHASINTTQIYTHVSIKRLHETIEQYHPREIQRRYEDKKRYKREWMRAFRQRKKNNGGVND